MKKKNSFFVFIQVGIKSAQHMSFNEQQPKIKKVSTVFEFYLSRKFYWGKKKYQIQF